MGDPRPLADTEALDEMGRQVAGWLAVLPPDPPADAVAASAPRRVVADRPLPPPDLVALDAALAAAEKGWADWRQRLAAVRRV